ncbi:cadmium resistance transporter [Methylocapsa acidiphila]|uniref:cadmium resistance transporter n=1 Tax=Methylocapsa acidiphila TaxID=133552 RepID=UPI0018DD5356|nr:cadmium resistance transporter [Methylocapsa acidiphila]
MVAATSYASTNFDNLAVLSAYGARPGYRPLFISLTFLCVCLTVLLASLALARAADGLPTNAIRYLGVIPLGLGAYHLINLVLGRRGGEANSPKAPASAMASSAYFSFALVLLANSGDTLGVMTPLLADLKPAFVLASLAAAVAAAVFMSSLAAALAGHPAVKDRLESVIRWALPILLIGVGLLILIDRPVDLFLS